MARRPTTHDPFNAVAEPRRRELLEAMGTAELSVNEIVERLGWNQPMVSKHLGVLKQVGLVNSYAGAIIPGMAGVFGIFLVRQYARSIPDELLEAARIGRARPRRSARTAPLPPRAPAGAARPPREAAPRRSPDTLGA